MQPTTVLWRDLTFDTGDTAVYRLLGIDGWENLPPPRYDKQVRTRAHGVHSSPVWADERIVTVEGRCWSADDRDALLHALEQAMTFDGGEETLTVSLAGRTLTAAAQLLRCDPAIVRGDWGVGRFGWAAQWRCPDPLRYGPATDAATGLPSTSGGLTYPLTYPLDYGVTGDPGWLVISNPGTAPAPVLFTVTGPLPLGFEISSAGERLTYVGDVPTGQVLTIDTATGKVLAEGTADRRANLTVADWIQIPPGATRTVQFTSLGGAYDPAATLTATVRGTYW